MKTIIFATSNKDKVREINEIAGDQVNVLTMGEIGFEEDIEENGKTFVDNATIKAKAIYDYICEKKSEYKDSVVLADDSGLEIDYYGGKPGVYSHRWLGEKTYEEKMQEVIDDMKAVEGADRGCRFVCAMAAFDKEGKLYTTRQTCEGIVNHEIVGENGFGYDPFFYMEEYGCTTAQMTPEKKNEVSHRGKALRAIMDILKNANAL